MELPAKSRARSANVPFAASHVSAASSTALAIVSYKSTLCLRAAPARRLRADAHRSTLTCPWRAQT